RRRPSRRQRALRVTAWSTAAVLTLGAGGGAFVYSKLNGNLSGVDINAALDGDRPAEPPGGSLDLLVLGSDSRDGRNAAYGTDEGSARADTAMIVHIAEDHRSADVVSIPRDTLVERPRCGGADGTAVPAAERAMFNESYALGGPACAVRTVEAMTDIRMDHYVEVDFTGFKKLIDTLGGVQVTIGEAIHDRGSRLDLEAGTHTLGGEQALGLVRTRKGVGDGSDLGRIQVQQAFVKALVEQTRDVDALGDPGKLLRLADTGTSALTTDSELASVNALASLAATLRGVSADRTEAGDVLR
ncbi:LCP family protein, partial [Streptomyces sparsus]